MVEITKTSSWTKGDGVNNDHMKGDKDNGEKCNNVNGHNGRKEKRHNIYNVQETV